MPPKKAPKPPSPLGGGGQQGGQQGGGAQGGGDTTQGGGQPQGGSGGGKANPPQPPDNPEISFYRKWLTETREQIQEREDILVDEKEGDATKEEAVRQLESLTREREHVEKRIEEEEQKELERQRQADEDQKHKEESARTRVRTPDYGEQTRRLGREWHLKKLKEAADALRTKLEEARNTLTARRERLQKIDDEIARLERENQHYTEGQASGNVDETAARTHVRDNTARINQLKQMKAELAKKLHELQRQYDEEFQQLKTEYQRRLWVVDAGVRRKAEAERMDEYFERLSELRRREQTRDLRNQTFESTSKGLEDEAKRLEAGGETSRAEEIRAQIENLKRGQAEWNGTLNRQIESLKDQIQELELRNAYEGVGPGSPEGLGQKLSEYETFFQNQLTNVEKSISQLEGMSTRSAEQNDRLKLRGLKGEGQGSRQLQAIVRQKIRNISISSY